MQYCRIEATEITRSPSSAAAMMNRSNGCSRRKQLRQMNIRNSGLGFRIKHIPELVALALLSFLAHAQCSCGADPLNTLLILIDDMRTEVGSYGSSDVKTPNLDAFAKDAVSFDRVYAQQALCGPSRLSMLTGRSTNSLRYYQHLDKDTELEHLTEHSNFPTYFGENGYTTIGTSKIAHFITNNNEIFEKYRQQPPEYDAESCGDDAVCPVTLESDTTDYHAVEFAIDRIETAYKKNWQWFMVLGIRRPHLSFRAPQSVFETFDESKISVVDSDLRSVPESAPWQAHALLCSDLQSSTEVSNTGFIDENRAILENDVARKLRMGYFASVQWVDELIGRVLSVVDLNTTLVVITSDHGWSLGEHGAWCKSSLYDIALRVPFMIRDPYSSRTPGSRDTTILNHLDLFPTLAELAGIPVTKDNMEDYELEGTSFANLMRPNAITSDTVSEVIEQFDTRSGRDWSYPSESAISTQPLCADASQLSARGITEQDAGIAPCRICIWKKSGKEVGCGKCSGQETKCDIKLRDILYMGFTIRVKGYRYTEWRLFDNELLVGDWTSSGLGATELYAHDDSDGGELGPETENLASTSPTKYASKIEELSVQLRAGFLRCDDSKSIYGAMGANSSISLSADDATSCSQIGDHCLFIDDTCHSRSFCDFSGSNAEQLCLERANDGDQACEWDSNGNKCLIATAYRSRSIILPTQTPTMAPTNVPTLKPTQSPTEHPTKQPTKTPTTPIPTASPTRRPTYGPTEYTSFCNMVHLTSWWQEQEDSETCISNQISNTDAASELEELCAAESPDLESDPPPSNIKKYWRWKKKYGRNCLAIDGCQYHEPLQKCVMNTCYNRNDGTCNIQDTGGRCVWYKRSDRVRGGDGNFRLGCYMNPCLLTYSLGSLAECSSSSDKLFTCTECERYGTCQIQDTFETSSECRPCTNSAGCYADNDTAQDCFAALDDPASCGWRKRKGTYWACNKCELKSCPNANNVLPNVSNCDTST